MASQSSSSGCAGRRPWVPKSFSVSTRPRPKYDLPEPVDRHPRRERVRRVDEPAGQVQPVAVGPCDAPAGGGRPGRPGATVSAGRVKSPCVEQVGLAGLRPLADDHRRDDLGRPRLDRGDRVAVGLRARVLVDERGEDDAILGVGPLLEDDVERGPDLLRLLLPADHVERRFPRLLLVPEGRVVGRDLRRGRRRRPSRRPCALATSSGGAIGVSSSSTLLKKAKNWKYSDCESGSYLWSWHWQQPIVRPSQTDAVVFTRSMTDSTRNCSTSIPPSWLIGVLRWNPVATFCARVAPGRRSPAIWSTVNSSNGWSRFRASMTQSRYGQIVRGASML